MPHSTGPAAEADVVTPHAEPADASPAKERRGCLPVGLGCLVVLVGIPMLICPGPGLATLGTGIGMIAVGLGLRKTGDV
ncbi:MAG: hypothetical protein JXA36_08285 [Coriobacteriia bacterium]|nr:hypothetical protein [Coriobacteriia bacterium]